MGTTRLRGWAVLGDPREMGAVPPFILGAEQQSGLPGA